MRSPKAVFETGFKKRLNKRFLAEDNSQRKIVTGAFDENYKISLFKRRDGMLNSGGLTSKDTGLIFRGLGDARGLPNIAFTCDEFFKLERSCVFSKSWVFAGRASTVTNPGDIELIEVSGQSLCIVRQKDGSIQVFHNVCPHRGSALLSDSCVGQKSIVCPYHAWTFQLDGTLKNRPHYHGPNQHEKQKRTDQTLPTLFEVQSAVWNDWVFVNLSKEPQDFSNFIKPLEKEWGEYDLSQIKFANHAKIDFQANWKLVVENYFDFYHVFKVHPNFHRALSDTKRQPTQRNGNFLHNFFMEDSKPFVSANSTEPPLPLLSEPTSLGYIKSVFGVLFPSTAINIHGSDLQFTHLEPLSADQTRMHRFFYFLGDAALSGQHNNTRKTTYQKWVELLEEDVGICNKAQLGRSSSAYDGGRFAPAWDFATHEFHKLIAESMASYRYAK